MDFFSSFSAAIADGRPFSASAQRPAWIGAIAEHSSAQQQTSICEFRVLDYYYIGNGIWSPHGAPKAPKQKLRKTSNYIIRDPRQLKNNILHYPFFGHIILF